MEFFPGGYTALPTPTRDDYSPFHALNSGEASGARTQQYAVRGSARMVPEVSSNAHATHITPPPMQALDSAGEATVHDAMVGWRAIHPRADAAPHAPLAACSAADEQLHTSCARDLSFVDYAASASTGGLTSFAHDQRSSDDVRQLCHPPRACHGATHASSVQPRLEASDSATEPHSNSRAIANLYWNRASQGERGDRSTVYAYLWDVTKRLIRAIVWQKVRGWARFNHLVRKSVAEKRSLRRVARFIRVYGLYILEIREIGGLASLR